MISKVITIVVINKTDKPIIKKNSAMFSYLILRFSFALLIAIKESILLAIKDMVAIEVNSSIIDVCFNLSTCNDVSTMKHKPSKLDEVLSICEDFEFSI